jgi:hypothetical protein
MKLNKSILLNLIINIIILTKKLTTTLLKYYKFIYKNKKNLKKTSKITLILIKSYFRLRISPQKALKYFSS